MLKITCDCAMQNDDRLPQYALRYRGLLARCTLDWYQRWPKEALVSIADHHLFDFQPECSIEVKYQLSGFMASMYDCVVDSCDVDDVRWKVCVDYKL